MSYAIEMHPDAISEVEASYVWYEDRSEGLGDRFIEALNTQLFQISSSPKVYSKAKDNYRQALIKNFPFIIIYEIIERKKVVFVSYVFHSKRNPLLKYKR